MNNLIARIFIQNPSSGSGVELSFEFPATGTVIALPLEDREPLRNARSTADKYLRRLVQYGLRLQGELRLAEAGLRYALNAGRELALLLAQRDYSKLHQLQAAFRQAWPTWEAPTWGTGAIPLIEVHGHGETFPLELLPMFDFGSPPAVSNDADLARVAARFLAFSAAVQRVPTSGLSADHVLQNEPALPIQFLRHWRLGSATDEERFLSSLTPYVDLDGPWPNAENQDQFRRMLLAALFDGAALGTSSGKANPPVQVQHFACHADTYADLDDDYVLILSTQRRGKHSRTITLGEMKSEGYDRSFADPPMPRTSQSVIVLNACGSSRINPRSASSFPQWFLECGHRAFIGTETVVPDGVATGFATAFYGRLIQGHRLGEAVVYARRDLIRDFHNPLGLLYVMYGDVELAVARSRPEIHRA